MKTDISKDVRLNDNLWVGMAAYLRHEVFKTGKSISHDYKQSYSVEKLSTKGAPALIFISDCEWQWRDNFLPEKRQYEKRFEILIFDP